MGTIFSSTGSDVFGRFMRMQGKQVFQPMGYDSFGIHSENFALKIGESPAKFTGRAIKNYERQFKAIGHGYDWTRTVTTSEPDYYRWTQWLFVQMFKAGLAYKKKASVNYCPSCKTVLSDEQIVTPAQAGKHPPEYGSIEEVPEGVRVCERCGHIPEKKELSQWFFRITKYADRLLKNLDIIDWSERVKVAQREWIGKKEGMIIKFDDIEVFTTRPDTLNGATFVAIPAEELGRRGSREKVGEFADRYVTNPLTRQKVPVWKANYVAAEYGSGAIMGVPAHDERDREFAEKYGIEVKMIDPDETLWQRIEKEGWGTRTTTYHLRDWLISRQRYWGPPIPMIYCEECAKEGKSWFTSHSGAKRSEAIESPASFQDDMNGWYPEEDLPVLLPDIEDYKPKGEGEGPLAAHPEFSETTCPKCGGPAKRETDVSDTFLDSAWYFLAYPNVDSEEYKKGPSAGSGQDTFLNKKIMKSWLPVNLYFGGAEHAVLHLMYARFVTMALHDLKLLPFEEPFPKFFAHGLMVKDGAKMSKSRGNVVNPDEYIEKYGADTLRLYLMFMGPMDGYPDFRDTGIEGMARFAKRLWNLLANHNDIIVISPDETAALIAKTHKTIRKVTEDIKIYHYNTAIAVIMELVNKMYEIINNGNVKRANGGLPRGERKRALRGIRCAEWDFTINALTKMLAPFTPHLAEEVWREVLGNRDSVHISAWPVYSEELVKEEYINIPVQVNGRLRAKIKIAADSANDKDEVERQAMEDENVKKWIEGKDYKVIFVPGRLINFVVR